MKNLIIRGYGISLRVKKGNIVLKSKKKTQTLPITDIDSIIVLTSGVTITSKAVRALTESGIQLIITDSRGMPVSILHHPFTTRTVDTKRAQYEAVYNGKANHLIKVLASSKTGNQSVVLRRLAKTLGNRELIDDSKKIEKISYEILRLKIEDLEILRREVMELEAEAARLYWGSIAPTMPREIGFCGRDQDSCDQLNASLNYGYGILYPMIWRAVVISGMDPYAGFLHVDRSGKPVLTFDLIEVFRAVGVDFPIIKSFLKGFRVEVKNCLLSPESRSRIAEVVLKNLKEKYSVGDQVMSLESWVKRLAYLTASYLRSKIELKNMIFR